MKAIILAAGYATRLYPLTLNTPKPLLMIGHKTILDHLLDRLARFSELDAVYVVTNSKFSPHFTGWMKQREEESRWSYALKVIDDGTSSNDARLGAIADIQFVIEREQVDDDLVVAAGDNVFQIDFADLHRFFQQKGSDVILAQHLNDPARLRQRGVVQFDDQARVIGFEEKPQHPQSEYVCPALYLHRRENIHFYRRYLLEGGNPDAPGHFIGWYYSQVRLYAFQMSVPAIDIGTLETYEQVKRQMTQNDRLLLF
jgi:glucose-1-phosphate thymidylyltransferase